MKRIETKTNSALIYEAPDCTSVIIDVTGPLCGSTAENNGTSGTFEELEWELDW